MPETEKPKGKYKYTDFNGQEVEVEHTVANEEIPEGIFTLPDGTVVDTRKSTENKTTEL